MVQNAIDGKIDLIVTKSVSRFARNTVDSLITIRKLKDAGCECYFEKEGVYTFDDKGELFLTIMSSLAQEESRSISDNVTWGQRKRFADGKFSLAYSRFLGYEKDEENNLRIVPEQAKIIRLIYKLFLEGKTTQGIARYLMEHGILSPAGKQRWPASTVYSILRNEKYKGDAILQKTFTADYLTKRMKKNDGEVPKYILEDAHEAIITPEQFDAVQEELDRRSKIGRGYSGKTFHSKLICGDCGGFYGRKVWHSTDVYRSVVYQCNSKFKAPKQCTTPTLTEQDIKTRFLAAYDKLIGKRDSIIADCEEIRKMLCHTADIEESIRREQEEMDVLAQMMKAHVQRNATVAMNQDEYKAETRRIEERYDATVARAQALEGELADRKRRSKEIRAFVTMLSTQPRVLMEWDERVWITLLDKATVQADGTIAYRFKCGTVILQ